MLTASVSYILRTVSEFILEVPFFLGGKQLFLIIGYVKASLKHDLKGRNKDKENHNKAKGSCLGLRGSQTVN